MPCYEPVSLPVKKPNGYPPPAFVYPDLTVPCGKCLGCRGTQAREWAIRMTHEQRCHEASWFLTLTYDEDHVPETGSLCAEDLQRFFKALRKRLPPRSLSYFACGEYGEEKGRPHYHAVLYGPTFLDRVPMADRGGHQIWYSPFVGECWDKGIHEIGTVTPASTAYVAGYVRKKLKGQEDPFRYAKILDPLTGELEELEAEFTRCSNRPAIGRRWIEKHWRDVYPRDFVVMEGKEFPPPRYYDKWLEEHHPELAAEVKWKRDEENEGVSDYSLAARKKIHEARVALFQSRRKC